MGLFTQSKPVQPLENPLDEAKHSLTSFQKRIKYLETSSDGIEKSVKERDNNIEEKKNEIRKQIKYLQSKTDSIKKQIRGAESVTKQIIMRLKHIGRKNEERDLKEMIDKTELSHLMTEGELMTLVEEKLAKNL